jgi:hypothetical protein
VLDATRTRADARLTYTRTLFAQLESLIDLALAAGTEAADAPAVARTWARAPATSIQEGGGR